MTELVAERRERAKAEKRRFILKAALRTFAEHGYENATISDILRQGGMTTSAFYNFFPDKDSVFLALVSEAMAPVLHEIEGWNGRSGGVRDLVYRVCRICFGAAVHDRALRQILARNKHKVRSLVQAPAARARLALLESEIRDAMERGDLPAVDSRLLAASLVGVMIETTLRLLEEDSPNVEAAARFVSSMISGGLERVAEDDDGSPGGGLSGDPTALTCSS